MKRWLFFSFLLLACLAALGYWWLFRPPPPISDGELLTYLPPTAEIAVFQRSLETDWLRLRRSAWFRKLTLRPELRKFAHKQGFDKEALSDAERWILDVIGERVLAGYVPDPQRPGRYSIFALAPVGTRAKRLEMWAEVLQHGEKAGFKMISSNHNGQEIVRVTVEDWPPNVVVKYAKARGVVVIVFSESENTLERYLDSGVLRKRRWGEAPPRLEGAGAMLQSELGGWLTGRLHGQVGLWRDRRGCFVWALDTSEISGFRLTARVPLASTPQASAVTSVTTSGLLRRLPANALLTAGGAFNEWAAVAEAFAAFFQPALASFPREWLASLRESAPWVGDRFAAALLPWQPMSSKLPIPVPQWAVAVEAPDQKAARAAIVDGLEELNLRTGWQLSLKPAERDGVLLDRVASASNKLAKQIERWPAMTFDGGMLLAVSLEDLLLSMLVPRGTEATTPANCALSWQVARTCQAARGTLSAYTLFLLVSGNEPPPALAPWLPRIEFAIDALTGLRSLEVTGKAEAGKAYLTAQATYEDPVPSPTAGK